MRDMCGTTARGTRRGGTTQCSRQDTALRDWARGLDFHHRHCGGPTCPGWGPRDGGAGSDARKMPRTCRRGSSRQAHRACPFCAPAPSGLGVVLRRSCEEFRQ